MLVLLLGAVVALIPATPRIRIDPNLILPLFLPPLVFAAAQRASWRMLWDRRRSIVALAGVLVLATIAAVAVTVKQILPGVSIGAAVALGALAAPPDPVAAEAVAGPLGLPRRLVTTLQTEGLCNDATALVVMGRDPADWRRPVLRLGRRRQVLYEAAAGVAMGVVVAWASQRLLKVIAQTTARNGLTLIVPFACYMLATTVEASGVLSVLAVGLFLKRSGEDETGVADRLSGGAFWDTIDLLITGVAFGLIGLELRDILDTGVDVGATVAPALIVCLVVLGVRFAWMLIGGPALRRVSPADVPASPGTGARTSSWPGAACAAWPRWRSRWRCPPPRPIAASCC